MPSATHRRLRHHVRAGLEVGERLAVPVAALVAGAHADDDAVLDQQLVGGGLGQDVDARLLGLLGEEAAELRDRHHVVAVVAEVGRHRLQRQRLLLGQQVDGVLRRPSTAPATRTRPCPGTAPASPTGACSRPTAGARRASCPSRSRRPAPRRASPVSCGLVLEQLRQPDRAGEPGGPAADDRDADLDALVLGVGRRADELLGGSTGGGNWAGATPRIARATRPSSPSRPRSAWA